MRRSMRIRTAQPAAERHCCDGQCLDGGGCPAMRLAVRQGVFSGPHRAPGLAARLVQALQRAARRVW